MGSTKGMGAGAVPQSILAELYPLAAAICRADPGDRIEAVIHNYGAKMLETLSLHYEVSEPRIVTDPRLYNEVERKFKLYNTHGWYQNGSVTINIPAMREDAERKNYTFGTDLCYTLLHEFRHHLQHLRRFKHRPEPDAERWAKRLYNRLRRLPETRWRKLEADRRCRAKNPGRYRRGGAYIPAKHINISKENKEG